MKTKLKLLTLAALLFAAFAGRSQCNANFAIYDQGLGTINAVSTAYGYADSSAPILFIWAFGDGTIDTTQQTEISHSYAQSGTYDVCLTVDSAEACSNQSCDTFQVSLCSGAAQFSYSIAGFGEESFAASYALSNAYTETWNFGDGGAGGGLLALHQYASDGNYNVCLEVAGPDCADTSCQLINVALCEAINIGFTYHVVSVNPYTAEFVATSPVNASYGYQWIFSDGGFNSGLGLDSVQHTFANNGTYTVTMYANNASSTCYDSVKQTITVDRCNLSPHLNESSYGVTAYFNTYLSDSSLPGISVLWGFPGGNPISDTNASLSVTYPDTGTYSATLYVSSQSGCVDTLYDTFVLTPAPPPSYTLGGTVTAGPDGGTGTVYLIVQDSVGHLALEDSTTIYLGAQDSSGTAFASYYFYNLPADRYYVKAALNPLDSDYLNFLPTYYTNALSWTSATAIDLINGDNTGVNIDLTPGNNPGGPGFVGGYVSQGAGIDVHTGGGNTYRSLNDPLAGVQINLLTSADEAVAYTFTDAGGHYQFADLAYGSYHIYAEQLNKVPVPIPFTLSPSDSSISSLNISINSDSVTATGINEVNNEVALTDIYPNPVLNKLEVLLNSKQPSTATIRLVDVLGKTILSNTTGLVQGNNKIELDMQNIAAGVYQLLIQTSGQQLTYKVVKAK